MAQKKVGSHQHTRRRSKCHITRAIRAPDVFPVHAAAARAIPRVQFVISSKILDSPVRRLGQPGTRKSKEQTGRERETVRIPNL